MTEERRVPIAISTPSTSKSFTFFDNFPIFVDVVEAVFNFEKLAIDPDSYTRTKTMSSPISRKSSRSNIVPFHRQGRFSPYLIPITLRWRRPSSQFGPQLYDNESLRNVKLKGDVEPLKLCIFDRKDFVTPCSVQAARPPSPLDGDIDELSEYFEHFVRVGLKMSALAESMYV